MIPFKFIQVNIYRGKYLEDLIDFLKKEDPDIVTMQEVATGKLNTSEQKDADLFKVLENELGLRGAYNGDFQLVGSEDSTIGNAVLTKFPILSSNVYTLKEFRPMSIFEIENDTKIWPLVPRHVLDLVVKIGSSVVHAMSCHGAWTAPPTDTNENMRQAILIAGYLKSLADPFILGADMNMPPDTDVVNAISKVANNLMIGAGVKQTTHPKIHKIAPRGYLVDYIFSSDQIKLKSLEVPGVTVSDHLPVVAQLVLD